MDPKNHEKTSESILKQESAISIKQCKTRYEIDIFTKLREDEDIKNTCKKRLKITPKIDEKSMKIHEKTIEKNIPKKTPKKSILGPVWGPKIDPKIDPRATQNESKK